MFSKQHGNHLESILKQRYNSKTKFIVLGLKSHKNGIYINNQKFWSLSEIKSVFGKILSSVQIGENLKEEQEELLKSLITYHPKGKEKLENFQCF